jgi:hypothetical protein
MQPWLDGLEHNENKNKTFRLQATGRPQASNKQQATSSPQAGNKNKGGTRPQARTMVRGAMSH